MANKEQRTILKIFKGERMVNFERFTYKTAKAIISSYKKAFSPSQIETSFFFKDYREADRIKIFATPDGCTEEDVLLDVTPKEFFKLISREEVVCSN